MINENEHHYVVISVILGLLIEGDQILLNSMGVQTIQNYCN